MASSIADDRPRESGVQAMRDINTQYGGQRTALASNYQPNYGPRPMPQEANSQSSLASSAGYGRDIVGHTPSSSRLNQSSHAGYGYGYDQPMPGGVTPYQGDGYDEFMDPRNIADDGEDPFEEPQRQRKSRFGGAGAAAGAAAGGAGMLKSFGSRDASGNYGPVPGDGNGGSAEKSEWLRSQSSGKKRQRWIVGTIVVLVIVGAVVGAVVGVLLNKSSGGGAARGSASDANGIWDSNSAQVQAVLNNKNLHKVFPGMDYTPLNAQYPDCLSNMPYQNDVTLDVAVLSQLTPAIRLYGTDCKQTEMVLKGIDLLGLNDTVKVWLGVYLNTNQTTNSRQLSQMYDILDKYPSNHLAGIIVGNEVLYREDLTITQLANQLTTVRQKIAAKGINLPVATADLGDDWTAALAADSDIVMANVHPFFAGVTPDVAPGWTWSFWQTHNVNLNGGGSGGGYPKNIISETGWPSQGGNDCGNGKKCPTKTQGAVAGIDEMNKFMDGWVCPSMANGTTYFWFEAFDVSHSTRLRPVLMHVLTLYKEPWKEMFNDPKTGDFWEPHWGLMDVDRNLKSGLKIPDCGGKTLDKPY